MDWSYLRNRVRSFVGLPSVTIKRFPQFPDLYIEFTSELRKVARGSMNVTDGFVTHETHRKQKILDLISLFDSGDLNLVRTCKFVSNRNLRLCLSDTTSPHGAYCHAGLPGSALGFVTPTYRRIS